MRVDIFKLQASEDRSVFAVSSSSVYQLRLAWTLLSLFCSSESKAVNSLLTVPNDDSGMLSWLGVVGPKRTWDLKLSPGLMSFMTTHFFQF